MSEEKPLFNWSDAWLLLAVAFAGLLGAAPMGHGGCDSDRPNAPTKVIEELCVSAASALNIAHDYG